MSTDKVRLLDLGKTCLQKRIGPTCKENERKMDKDMEK